MADESKQPETERKRRAMSDPRMVESKVESDALTRAAVYAGWAAALGIVLMLFWLAITSKFGLGPKIILGVSIVLAVFWLKYHWSGVRSTAGGRGVKLGTNSAVFVLFVLGALVLINIITSRNLVHIRHDFTENKLFSLSDQTRQVVRDLDQEVAMIAFPNPEGREQLEDRLREYEMLSSKLTVQTYDPMIDRSEVEQYNISALDTIIMQSGEREEKFVGREEEQITSAILAVTSGEKLKVYFLTGHGENGLEGGQLRSMQYLGSRLASQQYDCQPLTLMTMQEPKVPEDCAVLVIAGPTEPIGQKEMDAIVAYADQMGKLLVALEPTGPDLAELLEPHGIRPLAGMIIDPQRGLYSSAATPMVANFGRHAISNSLASMAVALPTTRALEVMESDAPEQPQYPGAPPPPEQKGQPLLESSPDAWLETATSGMVSRDPSELGGPLVMAAAVDEGQQPNPYGMPTEAEEGEGLRMVVIGDAEMMTDEFYQIGP